MCKNLKDFIQDVLNRNILTRKKLELKFDADKEKLTMEEKIDIMSEFKRLEGMAQAFKMIIDFIETKEKLDKK